MRLILTLAAISLCAITLTGQCPTQIPLWDQQQLEDTMALYPNCENYNGHIQIVDGTLTDLTPLSSLKSVKSLRIIRDTSLTSLLGLHNISNVELDVRVEKSPLVSDLADLASLTTVGDDFRIDDMKGVQSLEGLLPMLQSVGGDFIIQNLNSIDHVAGFSGLTSTGNFIFQNCEMIRRFEGFPSLEHVKGYLTIQGPILDTVSGPAALTAVDGAVQLTAKGRIDLSSLVTVGGGIYIRECASVWLDNLTTVGETLGIWDGTTDLRGLKKLETVGQTLDLVRTEVDTLPDFPELRTVGKSLFITDNEKITYIKGFNKLTSVGDNLFIAANKEQLKFIDGFHAVTSITGDLYIRDNEVMEEIDGFENVRTIGNELQVSFNDVLDQCDFLCAILDSAEIGGDIRILGNIGPCRSESSIRDYCDQPFIEVTLVDANAALWSSFLFDIESITEVDAEAIIENTSFIRQAVAADGATQVVVVAEFKESGLADFEINDKPLATPWGSQSIEIEGRHYCLALYNAPDEFDEENVELEDGIAISSQEISILFSDEDAMVSESRVDIELRRPPVVLVHGTYSSPEAWTMKSESMSMTEALEAEGFSVFRVDYTASNGSSGLMSSSFESNKEVVWANDGGIEDALSFYRDNLRVAATRADIVGHSLGALLPRLWASDDFNDEYLHKRNNYLGDINRIISLAGTHFGSDLGALQFYLQNASVFDVGLLGWLANGAALTLSWMNGATPSEAVRDQLPMTMHLEENALSRIGRTSIPTHAITLSVDRGMLKDPIHDSNEEYYNMYNYLSLLFYYNATMTENYLDHKLALCEVPGVKSTSTKDGIMPMELYPHLSEEEIFKAMFIEAIDLEGQVFEIMDGEWELPTDIEIFKFIMAEMGMSDWDPLIDVMVAGANPTDVAFDLFKEYVTPTPPTKPMPQEDITEAVRFMVFNNDDNDGTVRVESQSGRIEKECAECVSHFNNVLHGPAPQYSVVQDRVIELLTGGMDDFNINGIPAPDSVLPLYYPPINILQGQRQDIDAICTSGMVRSHARAFAQVSDLTDAVIIVRPVNPDATPLIENGAATKKMDIKPKSSDWGPQKGYLPVNQRYSKLWTIYTGDTRLEQIEAYNSKAMENISSGIAKARPLVVKACNHDYMVMIDSSAILGALDANAADEVVLIPLENNNIYCLWGEVFDRNAPITDCSEITAENNLHPLEVMATPEVLERDGVTPRYLTADYDLLMVGFYIGENNPYEPPDDIPFKPNVGQMTLQQENLASLLNTAVRNTGYTGGNVTHHGPENQFDKSPYIDYPLTAFLPGDPDISGDWEIRTIRMGKPGFRDAELKLFLNQLRKKGFDLYDNTKAPGWKWTWNEGMQGFELEDSPQLNDYVEELDLGLRTCDSKTGSFQTSSADCPAPMVTQAERSASHPGSLNSGRTIELTISPNPARGSDLTLYWKSNESTSVRWRIIDQLGTVRQSGEQSLMAGDTFQALFIGNLPSGSYALVTDQGLSFPLIIIR